MAFVEVAGRSVVLHQQRAAVLHVVEQPLIVLLDCLLRVVGANTKDDRAESAQVSRASTSAAGSKRHVEPEFAQHVGNIVARAHDVADLQLLRDLYLHQAGALASRLEVKETADVGTRDQTVAVAVVAAIGAKKSMHLVARFLRAVGQLLELRGLLPGSVEGDVRGLRLDRSNLAELQDEPCHCPRSAVVRTSTPRFADGLFPARMICVAGDASTENGGTTANGIDHDIALGVVHRRAGEAVDHAFSAVDAVDHVDGDWRWRQRQRQIFRDRRFCRPRQSPDCRDGNKPSSAAASRGGVTRNISAQPSPGAICFGTLSMNSSDFQPLRNIDARTASQSIGDALPLCSVARSRNDFPAVITAASTLPSSVENSAAIGRPSGVPGPSCSSLPNARFAAFFELMFLCMQARKQVGLLGPAQRRCINFGDQRSRQA